MPPLLPSDGLGLIRENRVAAQGSIIAMNVPVMNRQKLLELLAVALLEGSTPAHADLHQRRHLTILSVQPAAA
jgi:hypothetical protein